MIIQEIWRLINGEHYFYKWWNWFTAAMLLIFLAAAVFFVMGFAIAGKWSSTFAILRERIAHRMLLLGNSCFSIASVLSVWHFGNLCQVNALFGPIQISVYRMFKDILKFLTFFLGIFLAFTLGVRNLYSYSRSLQLEIKMKENSTESDFTKTSRRLNTWVNSIYFVSVWVYEWVSEWVSVRVSVSVSVRVSKWVCEWVSEIFYYPPILKSTLENIK